MSMTSDTGAHSDNASYEQGLVTSLLDSMVPEEAIQFCVEHGWDQTLQAILQRHHRKSVTAPALGGRC